jgi:hypothetical protein
MVRHGNHPVLLMTNIDVGFDKMLGGGYTGPLNNNPTWMLIIHFIKAGPTDNRQLSCAVGDYLRPIDSLISRVNRFGNPTSLG